MKLFLLEERRIDRVQLNPKAAVWPYCVISEAASFTKRVHAGLSRWVCVRVRARMGLEMR